MKFGADSPPKPRAATVPEVILLFTTLFVVGAALWAVVLGGDWEDRQLVVEHNLSKLRSTIEEYRLEHGGITPPSLEALTRSTNFDGKMGGRLPCDNFPLGPYLDSLPENPLVAASPDEPKIPSSGWLYDPRTGQVDVRPAAVKRGWSQVDGS